MKYRGLPYLITIIILLGIIPQIMIVYNYPWLVYGIVILSLITVFTIVKGLDWSLTTKILVTSDLLVIVTLFSDIGHFTTLKFYGLNIIAYAVLDALVILVPGFLLTLALLDRAYISSESITISVLLGMFVLFLIGFTSILLFKHIEVFYVRITYIIIAVLVTIIILKSKNIKNIYHALIKELKEYNRKSLMILITVLLIYLVMSLKILCSTFLPSDTIRHYSWSIMYYFNGLPHVKDILWLGGRGGYPYGLHVFVASLYAILGVEKSYIIFHSLIPLTIILVISMYSLIKHIIKADNLRNLMLLLAMTSGFSSVILIWIAFFSPIEFVTLSWDIGTRFDDLFLQGLLLPLSLAPIRIVAVPSMVMIILLSYKYNNIATPRNSIILLSMIAIYATLSHVFEPLYILIVLMLASILSSHVEETFSFTRLLISLTTSIAAMSILDYASGVKYYTVYIDSIHGDIRISAIYLLIIFLSVSITLVYIIRWRIFRKQLSKLLCKITSYNRESFILKILIVSYMVIYISSFISLILILFNGSFNYLYDIIKGYNTPLPALILYLGPMGLLAFILLVLSLVKDYQYNRREMSLLIFFLFTALFTSIAREINAIPFARIQTAFGTYRYALIEKIMLLFTACILLNKIVGYGLREHILMRNNKRVFTSGRITLTRNLLPVLIYVLLLIGITSSTITIEVASRSLPTMFPFFISPLIYLGEHNHDAAKILSAHSYLDIYVESFTGLNSTLTLKDFQNIIRDNINPLLSMPLINNSKVYVVSSTALGCEKGLPSILIEGLEPIVCSDAECIHYIDANIGGKLNSNNLIIISSELLSRHPVLRLLSIIMSIYDSSNTIIAYNKSISTIIRKVNSVYNWSRIVVLADFIPNRSDIINLIDIGGVDGETIDIFVMIDKERAGLYKHCSIINRTESHDVNFYHIAVNNCTIMELEKNINKNIEARVNKKHYTRKINNIGFISDIRASGEVHIIDYINGADITISSSNTTIKPSSEPNILIVTDNVSNKSYKIMLPATIIINGTTILDNTYIQLFPYRIALARSVWEDLMIKGLMRANMQSSGEAILVYNINYTHSNVCLYKASFDVLRSYVYTLLYAKIYDVKTICTSISLSILFILLVLCLKQVYSNRSHRTTI